MGRHEGVGVIHDKRNNERALPRLLTSELLLSLFFFDALAHFIFSALTPPTPLPTCPTKPPPLNRGELGANGAVGAREEVIILKAGSQ